MRPKFALFLAAIMLATCLFSACSNNTASNNSTGTVTTAGTADNGTDNTDSGDGKADDAKALPEGAVFSECGVTMYIKNVYIYNNSTLMADYSVTNESSETVTVVLTNLTAENYSFKVGGFSAGDMAAGSSTEGSLSFDRTDLTYQMAVSGIESVSTIGIDFQIFADGDGDGKVDYSNQLYDSKGAVSFSLSEPVDVKREDWEYVEGTLVYEDDNVKFYALGAGEDFAQLSDSSYFYFRMENKTDYEIGITSTSGEYTTAKDVVEHAWDTKHCLVNGVEVPTTLISGDVAAGTNKILAMEMDLDGTDITVETMTSVCQCFKYYNNDDALASSVSFTVEVAE